MTIKVKSPVVWGAAIAVACGVVAVCLFFFIGRLIGGTVGAVVAVLVVCLILLNKAKKSFLDQRKPQLSSDQHLAAELSQPVSPVVTNSQVEFGPMERFLRDLADEKPIRFSPEQLENFTNSYSTRLGSGAYGVVFKGELPNRIPVAVKVLTSTPDKRIEEQFMAEVGTIGRTYHINLVRLYGFCFDSTTRALVYEFMENGSLDKFLFDEKREIEWEKLHEIAIGTAKGISYLHEECQKRIIHYDIKPGNILLDGNLRPKVADFGLAKLCNVENSMVSMTGYRGTPGYAAPELWMPYPVSHKCDVYSFGVLLFEIIGRRRHYDVNADDSGQWLPRWTWDSLKNNELAAMLALCGMEEKNRDKAERMALTALWCVQFKPEARPLMSTVVKMLEGEIRIDRPPNPFEHFESFTDTSGIDEDWSSSTLSIESIKQKDSISLHCTMEKVK